MMKRQMIFGLIFLFLLISFDVKGEKYVPVLPDDAFAPVLIPILWVPESSSQWGTRYWEYNGGDEEVITGEGNPYCQLCIPNHYPNQIEPREIRELQPRTVDDEVSVIFYFEERLLGDVSISSQLFVGPENRVVAQLPIVREHELLDQTTSLVGIPVNGESRISLRIYSMTGTTESPHLLTWRICPHGKNTLIVSGTVALTPTNDPLSPQFLWRPGRHLIHGLASQYPVLQNYDRIRIEMEPLSEGMKFWGFASVTTNGTNEVVLFTPE